MATLSAGNRRHLLHWFAMMFGLIIFVIRGQLWWFTFTHTQTSPTYSTDTTDVHEMIATQLQNNVPNDVVNTTYLQKDMKYIIVTKHRHKIVNGIYVPTLKRPTWYGHGVSNDCNLSDKNSDIINISMYREDGIGTQLTEAMIYIAFYLTNPHKYHYYYFPPQVKTMHDSNKTYDLRQIGQFMNIGYGERNVFNIHDKCICCHYDIFDRGLGYKKFHREHLSLLFNQTVLQYLRQKYLANKYGLNVYNTSMFNVAVHIRRGDTVTQNEKRTLSDGYFIRIMKYVFDKIPSQNKIIMFHIYSEFNFNKSQFETELNLSKRYVIPRFNIKYHVDTYLNLTFHGMVTADAFIMSKSRLSYSAAILSQSKYIFFPTGWFQTRPQWIPWIQCYRQNPIKQICMSADNTTIQLRKYTELSI